MSSSGPALRASRSACQALTWPRAGSGVKSCSWILLAPTPVVRKTTRWGSTRGDSWAKTQMVSVTIAGESPVTARRMVGMEAAESGREERGGEGAGEEMGEMGAQVAAGVGVDKGHFEGVGLELEDVPPGDAGDEAAEK